MVWPRKLRIPRTVVGGGSSLMTPTFLGSTNNPSWHTTCPRSLPEFYTKITFLRVQADSIFAAFNETFLQMLNVVFLGSVNR